MFRCKDTEGGHFQIGSLSYSVLLLCPTQCQRDGTTIYVAMQATRDTLSLTLKGENKALKAPPAMGLEPGAAGMTGTYSIYTTALLLP